MHRVRQLRLFLVSFASAFFLLLGCASPAPQPVAEAATLTLSGQTFMVELADTPAERQRGLMGRLALPAGHGMLFIFDAPQRVAFWMKQTLIPLDILYFNGDYVLQQIYADTPPCVVSPESTEGCPTYPSDRFDIRYVLELPAGTAAAIGARVGDRFEMQ